jgi:hypothetical protein
MRRLYTPAAATLRKALERACRDVQEVSGGRQIVYIKEHMQMLSASDVMAKLVVFVPIGDNQHTEVVSAVDYFEKSIAIYLEAPVDTTLRTIEGEEAKCAKCGMHAIWVRIPQHGSKQHFCNLHAQQQPDFDDNSDLLSYPMWERLQPINIY